MSVQVRVLIVTEHHLFRECLAAALVAADSSFEVSLADGLDLAGSKVAEGHPDVLIVDLHPLSRLTSAETKQLAQQFPGTPILVVGQPQQEEEIVAYLEAGAADYRISQDESIDSLCDAIHRVLRGEVSHSPERARALFSRLQELARRKANLEDIDTSFLTRRELQILRLVDEGKSNKQIAAELYLSLHTVKNHVHRILEKLNVKNRREAAHLADTQGWLKTCK